MSQQSIKMRIDHITENSDDDTGDFLPTNFDVVVDEFIEACLEDYNLPVAKQVFAIKDFIFCVIDYRPMTVKEKASYQELRAEKTGIITNIKDVQFNT